MGSQCLVPYNKLSFGMLNVILNYFVTHFVMHIDLLKVRYVSFKRP